MIRPIQIKRPDVTEDIRKLAELTALPITDAVAKAVRNQLAVEKGRTDERTAKRVSESRRHVERIWNLPVVGPRLSDDDLYDEEGMPK